MPYPFSTPVPEYGISNTVNQFMSGQANRALAAGLPGAGGLMRQSSANTMGLLRGQVPTDVTQQIQQRGAERGVAMGSPGSPNANAAWLRALGLTSLGLQQQGEQNLTGAIARTPIPELWNPMALYVPERTAFNELQAARGAGGGGGGWGNTGSVGDLWGAHSNTWRYSSPSGALM